MSIERNMLLQQLNGWMDVERFQDYCPNGLQVEGKNTIAKLVTGVTASQAFVDAAIDAGADAILVHHGYFWKGEDAAVVGMKKRRLQAILAADINLFAYHLPLDCHLEFGNNAQLAQRLGLRNIQPTSQAPEGILLHGEFADGLSIQQVQQELESVVVRPLVAHVDGGPQTIKRVAICTGGGQSFIEAAVTAGADLFISGEISEPTVHVARECGIHYMAAGHHATERFGVQALGDKIAAEYGVDVEFIDIDSPA